MALNLKDLAKKSATDKKARQGALGQGKTAARPWEVESWEKPAATVEPEDAEVSTSSGEHAPAEVIAMTETAAPVAAWNVPVDPSATEPTATEDADPQESVLAHSSEERRGTRTAASGDQDLDLGVDDVISFVEDLKIKLRSSQKSKRALEEVVAASKTKIEEVGALSVERARELVQLNQEIARLKGENEQQLAELCRADDDRSEAALVLKRLKANLAETRTEVRTREEQIARLQAEVAKTRQLAEAREEQVAASHLRLLSREIRPARGL